ncbi:septum site-determining protein MinC [Oceanobacillus limi]|uniref:Probable septum site-determining protein MinC n=1 Tax=Oceanobacillus limi TaxID=930131 RepID=A0A1I0GG52_9BACI|nr:septum site-determining protein MinC [Oceanobacillus limi]SET70109.1 septum site-determining protein MinC [Oceanobacillus limi]
MHDTKQLITIKGTREGLTLFIDDTCSFDDAFHELREKLVANQPHKKEPCVPVTIKLGNRYLQEGQEESLLNLINDENRFRIQSIESDVIAKSEALSLMEDSEVKTVSRIIRSGQVLEVTGDLLLIGDVNPGGCVISTGNIYIMGHLHGIAHAGSGGDRNAVIAAAFMNPSQLRIADYISRAPDYESDGVYMECGLIDEEQDKIIIDRLQVLAQKRKTINRFERRITNG